MSTSGLVCRFYRLMYYNKTFGWIQMTNLSALQCFNRLVRHGECSFFFGEGKLNISQNITFSSVSRFGPIPQRECFFLNENVICGKTLLTIFKLSAMTHIRDFLQRYSGVFISNEFLTNIFSLYMRHP